VNYKFELDSCSV